MSRSLVSIGRRTVPEFGSEYANSRLHGMRSHLLPATVYQELIDDPDAQSAARRLLETAYAPELEAAFLRGFSAGAIDDALKENMIRSYRTVLRFLPAAAQEVISTLLARWDVFNLKALFRAAHHHISADETAMSVLPVGFLAPEDIKVLSTIGDVKALVDSMMMWGLVYASSLREAYPAFHRSNDLAPLELALDRHYSSWASGRLAGDEPDVVVARRVLGTQIDTTNLVTVLRMLRADRQAVDPADYFLPGGRVVHEDVFLELAGMSDVDPILNRLRETPYGPALDAVAMSYLERGSISVFERALEDRLIRTAMTASSRDPEGVGIAISYLYGKQNEVTNLRVVLRGKTVGMPAERIHEELILV
jgi:V/A-type H+/Na+-transporting ATPase subunit C